MTSIRKRKKKNFVIGNRITTVTAVIATVCFPIAKKRTSLDSVSSLEEDSRKSKLRAMIQSHRRF